MINPTITDFRKITGDLITFVQGYSLSATDAPILNHVSNTLLQIVPGPSQGAVDEIAKMIAGVVVAVISRYSLALLEKWQTKRKQRKQTKIENDANEKNNEQKES